MSDEEDDVRRILQSLTARERAALESRFGIRLDEDASLEDVRRQFDVTRQRIRDIERKALKKLGHDVPDVDFENERKCSFCGKYESEVVKMIEASSGACICNDCIEDCTRIIQNQHDDIDDWTA